MGHRATLFQKRPAWIFCALLTLLLSSPALSETRAIKTSGSEDVAMAFYKTAGEKPSFDKWIKGTAPYNLTPMARREEIYTQEYERLSKRWIGTKGDNEYLVIKAWVSAHTYEQPAADPSETTPFIGIKFAAGDVDYFPYEFLGENFALVPQDMAGRLTAPLPREQFNFLNQEIGPQGARLMMLVELKPVRADTNETYKIDKQEFWALLTDVAALSIWSKSGTLLWEYSAPWYATAIQSDLKNLYQEPAVSDTP